MKILKKATIIVAGICILYWMVGAILSYTPLLYRSWVEFMGRVLTMEVLPTLLLLLAGKWFYKVVKGETGLKIVLGVIVAWIYIHWIFLTFLIILFTTQGEERLTKHLLIMDEAAYINRAYYRYYQPIAFFFKMPTMLTEALQIEYLEEKYDRAFIALDEHLFFEEENPLVEVVVWSEGMGLCDNYAEALCQYYVESGCEILGINRDYYVIEDTRGTSGWVCMELESEADIEAFAGDAFALIQYAMEQTKFFKNHRGILCFYQTMGEEKLVGYLPFGKLSRWDKVQPEYYKDVQLVTERIQEEYEKAEADLAEKLAHEKEQEENIKVECIPTPVPEEPALETMARQVFDEVLSEQGYLFQVKYNAKGNLYIDLGSRPAGETGDKSNEGYYRFTLVYDRTSENGECELFVLYKEHYTEEDVNDGTAILNMYAVEKDTGMVIASGKQAWSDVGTKEYREATGE